MAGSEHSGIIPPSPNWYLSGAVDCHRKTGVLAYAASRSLVLVWPVTQDIGTSYPVTSVIPDVHKNRVTCVSWNQTSDDPLLCTAGEDGRICLWNAENQSLLFEHNCPNEQKVTSLAWSPVTHKKRIAFSLEDGSVYTLEFLLNYESSQLRKLYFGKVNAIVLTFNPHFPYMMAIGCKGGLLYICDTRENRGVLHKLRAHEEDVHSVSWCPVKDHSLLKKRSPDEYFLATSGRDKSLKIWEVSGGKCVVQTKLPGNTGVQRGRSGADDKRWTALYWLNERTILSNGLGGELLSWEAGSKLSWKMIHKIHSRGLFNIVTFKTEDGKEYVWSSAQDRNVVLWPLENRQAKEILGIREMEMPYLCLPTIGGFTYTICNSPIDPSHVALGLGDHTIRLWNMASGKPEMTMFWNGIKGKVTSLAWHPKVEGRLAFGTDEGRVGVFDTLAPNKSPLLSKSYHKGTVYNLGWGVLPSNEDLFLYSCGGNHIFVHNYAALDTEAKNFNQLVKNNRMNLKFPSRTDFEWKSDFSVLAVGNEDGSVEIYSGDELSLLMIILAHKKLIQCLRWHPLFTFEKVEPSQYGNWLAIASTDTTIKVFEVTVNEDQQSMSNAVATLSGHKERVVSLAWNLHEEGKLVSASYDKTAQVWDVLHKTPIANYSGHAGRLLCCEWSAIDADTIITGGDDLSVRLWKISEQNFKTPTESITARTAKEKSKTASKAPASVPARSAPSAASSKKKTGPKLKSLFSVSANLEGRGRAEGLKDCKILATSKGIPLQHSVPSDCTENYSCTDSEFGCDQLAHLGFFTGSEATKRMLNGEIKHHEEAGNFDLATHLRVWQDDIETLLTEAVKQKQLSDWHVALAPRVSHEFWMEMCELYASQLAEQGDIRKAVSYLLICGQSVQALELLNLHQLYREATAITRCLYPDGSQEVQESLSRWAAKALTDGNVELATKCMLANNEVDNAARTLARRLDPAALTICADLANSIGLNQLASAYLGQASAISASQDAAQQTNAESSQNGDNDGEENAKPNADILVEQLQELAVKQVDDGTERDKPTSESSIPV